jgi:oxidase EvaA
VGIDIKTDWGNVPNWQQPIINQPEIGFLGIITKKINGVLLFLMQAKIEPGNINYVQLSPTLQATKSNYTMVHKGKRPLYLEYFNGEKTVTPLVDQLQSEQGARFLRKRNRNVIVEVTEDIPVYDNFCWLTLGQIKHLLRYDNLINMDSRTVISCIKFGSFGSEVAQFYSTIENIQPRRGNCEQLFLSSAILSEGALHSYDEIFSWITRLKSRYELDVTHIPLTSVKHWVRDEYAIYHEAHKYFKVIGVEVEIGNREVQSWCQPLVESAQEGIMAFIVKKINGIYHFLVQAKLEAGNFDIIEMAPTVQCLTGNYREGEKEYEPEFLSYVLQAGEDQILYSAFQSEEGGRFYREQNKNIILEADDNFPLEVPENFIWLTLNQILSFIQYNNYINVEARSLIAAVNFV